MISKIDHIGIAVKNLREAIETYRGLFGKEPEHMERVASQKVNVAMFRAGESAIELLEGQGGTSPIAKFIDKRGEGMHHICLQVENLQAAIQQAEASGMELITGLAPEGAGGTKVVFLHPKTTHGVLIELVVK